MACVMQFVPALAATATQLAPVAFSETGRELDRGSERTALRMNWVAVTDNRGKRKLEIRWVLPPDERSSSPDKSDKVTLF